MREQRVDMAARSRWMRTQLTTWFPAAFDYTARDHILAGSNLVTRAVPLRVLPVRDKQMQSIVVYSDAFFVDKRQILVTLG